MGHWHEHAHEEGEGGRGHHGHGRHGHPGRSGRYGHGFGPGRGYGFGPGPGPWFPRRFNREEWLRRLEEYQRDLEQEAADVADLIRRLKEETTQKPAEGTTV
jgi:hypothetical protein